MSRPQHNPDARKVAVITDVMSEAFSFPLWHRYYGSMVQFENLYVARYQGSAARLDKYPLGGIWDVPQPFEESTRAAIMSALVSELLKNHEIVVRVDVDEFAVPDPRRHPDLATYLRTLEKPFVTARGLDIIQHPDEPPLDWTKPVLRQRAYAYATTSLNKTCVTTMGLRWSSGFHGCTVHPMFDDLLLLHLKRADIDTEVAWSEHMTSLTAGDSYLQSYYDPTRSHIEQYHHRAVRHPIAVGWDGIGRLPFDARFYAGIRYDRESSLYEVAFLQDDMLIRLPEQLRGVI